MVEDILGAGANPSLTPKPIVLVPGVDRNPELGMPTCLGLAASKGNRSMVDTLITHSKTSSKARQNISAFSKMGANALHFAAQVSGHGTPQDMTATVFALADLVDINATLIQRRETAVHVACSTKNVSAATVHALLAVGGDVNAVDLAKNTALHLACRGSLESVVQILLLYGADDTATNARGKTPADMIGLNRHAMHRVLAAHRAWRRRGWLVLCRVRATKSVPSAGEGKSLQHVRPTTKKASVNGGGGSGGRIDAEGGGEEQETGGFAQLMDDVIDSEEEGIFRLVVSFL